MTINIENLNINLYDGDTEMEGGESFQVKSITITKDYGLYLNMDNGETWNGADLSNYETELIIDEITDIIRECLIQNT